MKLELYLSIMGFFAIIMLSDCNESDIGAEPSNKTIDTIANVYFGPQTLDFPNQVGLTRSISFLLDSSEFFELSMRYTSHFNYGVKNDDVILQSGNDNICFLNRIDSTLPPYYMVITSLLQIGDTIYSDVQMPGFEWWCTNETNVWLKFIIGNMQQGISYLSLPEGINYLGVQYPKQDGNHAGWLKLNYSDTSLTVYEAHFNTNVKSKIFVGQTE